MQIIAHRGASDSAPENTLASVSLAWQQNADAVEIDVRLTRDGRIAVIHDPTTRRTAGRGWRVAGRTLAELQTLDAGRKKGAAWRGQRIPSLEQVLATVPDGKRLLIEIKCGLEIVPELARVLGACGKKPAQTVVICFDLMIVEAVKRRIPRVPVYWLRGTRRKRGEKRRWSDRFASWIDTCRRGNLSGLDLARGCKIRRETVDKIRDAGLELYVWTVNAVRTARKLAALGVDGIATDRPGWMRERLQE